MTTSTLKASATNSELSGSVRAAVRQRSRLRGIVPAPRGRLPALSGIVPALYGSVRALYDRVRALNGSVPALPAGATTPAPLPAIAAGKAPMQAVPTVVMFNKPTESSDGPWFSFDYNGGSFLCKPAPLPPEFFQQ